MRIRRLQWAAMGFAMAFAMAGSASALMLPMSVEDLAVESKRIVHGRIIRQESAWNESRTAIYTDVTLAVEQTAVGAKAAELTFRIDGGEVDGIGMATSNAPHFENGQELVVFLEDRAGAERLVSHSQGAFEVTQGKVSARGGGASVAERFQRALAARENRP